MPRKLIALSTNTASDSDRASCTPERLGGVGQHVAPQHPPAAGADRLGRLDVRQRPHLRIALRSTRAKTGVSTHAITTITVQRPRADHRGQADGEDQRREGEHHVERALQADVDGPTTVPSKRRRVPSSAPIGTATKTITRSVRIP